MICSICTVPFLRRSINTEIEKLMVTLLQIMSSPISHLFLLKFFLLSGPPPLSKDTIDALPKVEITQEQVDTKLQCSVCWEDFVLKETVYQLPCQHVYHETCIRRWLELHGTCPICRQNLSGNEQQSNNEGEQNSDGLGSRGKKIDTY